MTFLTPGLALLAAGIGVPALILLHVLRLRRLPQRVPTTLMWRRSVQDLEANVPFQRLRVSWLFVLQMLALLCAAMAAGQPIWRSNELASSLVLVVDTRARMRAIIDPARPAPEKVTGTFSSDGSASDDAAPPMTRFDSAKQRARAILQERSTAETQVHLVVSRAAPGLIASGSPGAIRDALDRLIDSDEPGDPAAAMALAAEVAPDGEIIWIGDERGERADNVGLAILSAQPSAREPGMVDVLISAVNAGTQAVDAPLIVTLAGTTQGARVLRLPAAAERPGDLGRATLLLRVPSQPGALLEARLQSRDALPIDDTAALRFAPPTPIRVVFMAPDAAAAERSPLRALLSVMDSVRVEQRPCGAPRETLEGFDLIVADGCMPSVVAAASIDTPWLVFAGGDASKRWRASVPGAARAHPVMVGVPPLTVDVATDSVAQIATALPTGAIPLLVDGDDTVAFVDPHGPGVRFRFPLAATDWPADPSWVMTMQNVVQWLVGDSGESAGQAIRTGTPARVLAERRDGARAWITVPPQRRLNAVVVRTPDGAEATHPVSLLDESQSDLRFLPAPADPRGFERATARRIFSSDANANRSRSSMNDDLGSATGPNTGGGPRPLWPWLALAALLLLATEWCVYLSVINRRAG